MVNGTTYLPEPEEYDIVEEIDDKTVSVINENKVPGYMREGTFIPRKWILELFHHAMLTEIKGYHVELSLYPAGGLLDVDGCEDCGTDEKKGAMESWNKKRKQTILDAIDRTKRAL